MFGYARLANEGRARQALIARERVVEGYVTAAGREQITKAAGGSPFELTDEQSVLLDRRGPLFVQGVAGSGKTTLLVNIAWRRAREPSAPRVLLVLYTEHLRQYALSLLRALSGEDVPPNVDVLTYRQLCERCAEALGLPRFAWLDDPAGIHRTLALHASSLSLAQRYSLTELQQEVRAAIKGACLDPETPLLPIEQYLARRRGADLHGSPEHRRAMHALAQRYQALLSSRGQVDDMDAARALLARPHDLPHWSAVLVDECQDYTAVQLCLLASLASSSEGLAFVGDEHQVVYPSGFGWTRVSDAVYAALGAKVPAPATLTLNHRNPAPIVRLGQRLLSLRSRAVGGVVAPAPRSDGPQHATPLRVRIRTRDLEHFVEQVATRVASLGILFDEADEAADRQWEFRGIGFRRSFTARASKGLEFDVVCLVRLGRLGAKLLAPPKRSKVGAATRALKFNEVYVAVTRARALLIVVEEEGERRGLWDEPTLCECFREVADVEGVLADLERRLGTVDERGWRAAAEDFERQMALAPAAECWEKAGDRARAADCYAKIGRWGLAAELYAAIGRDEAAATCWERGEDFERAAASWELVGERRRQASCLEKAGALVRAAACWLEADEPRTAAACYERAGRWELAAQAYASACDHELEAQAWERGARHLGEEEWLDRAASARYRSGTAGPDYLTAWRARSPFVSASAAYYRLEAQRHLEARRLHETARAFDRAGAWEQAAEIWKGVGEHRSAVASYEAAGLLAKAAQVWCTIGDAARGKAQKAKDPEHSAACFREAAEAYARAGRGSEARQAWRSASERHADTRRYPAAAEAAERGDDWKRAAALWRLAKDWARADAIPARRVAVHRFAPAPPEEALRLGASDVAYLREQNLIEEGSIARSAVAQVLGALARLHPRRAQQLALALARAAADAGEPILGLRACSAAVAAVADEVRHLGAPRADSASESPVLARLRATQSALDETWAAGRPAASALERVDLALRTAARQSEGTPIEPWARAFEAGVAILARRAAREPKAGARLLRDPLTLVELFEADRALLHNVVSVITTRTSWVRISP